jgi:hypothetical protein
MLAVHSGTAKACSRRRGIVLKISTRSSFLTAVWTIVWIFSAVWLHAQDAQFHDAPPSGVQSENPYVGQQMTVAAGSRTKDLLEVNRE